MLAERIDGVYLPRNPKASPLCELVSAAETMYDNVDQVYEDSIVFSYGQLYSPAVFHTPLFLEEIRILRPPGGQTAKIASS